MQRTTVRAKRCSSLQQLIRHATELVDIGGGNNGLPTDLLGRGVFGRHPAKARARTGRFSRNALLKHLRETEIEQLHFAGRRDEDVRRLEVTMDDALIVRVVDRFSDVEEDLETLWYRQ